MDEENLVHMYNGILLSHKKEFAITWVDIEIVILSEVIPFRNILLPI